MTKALLVITEISVGEALAVAGLGIVVVMVVLALLAGIIMIMSRIITRMTKEPAAQAPVAPAAPAPAPVQAAAPQAAKPQGKPIPATQSRGECDLVAVDEQTAAMIMAIVADQLGEPLNTLRFQSIRRID